MKIFRFLIAGLFSFLLIACGSDSKDNTSITATSSATTVKVGQTLTFTATVTGNSNTDVSWKVDQTNGGTITDEGLYTAPDTPGTYSVTVTSDANKKRSARLSSL
jgi:predicted secreted protein